MAIYTVLAPPASDGDAAADPMRLVFIREGFSWAALFIALPWLIFRRLWLVLAGYVGNGIVVAALVAAVTPSLVGVAIVLFHFLFALEANELRRSTLLRHGYRIAGVVEGRGMEEAEIRYFAGEEAAPVVAPAPTPPAPLGMIRPSAEAGDVVGLFPAPGGMS